MGIQFDPAFIQDPKHRSNPTIPTLEGIPLIDLSPILTASTPTPGDHIPPSIQTLIQEVESACKVWGFFQVVNHGVPIELLERIQVKAKEFFALSLDEKRRIRRDGENFFGYYDTEHTKNVRDWKEVFDITFNEPIGLSGTSRFVNRWPEFPVDMRDACMEYSKAMEKLAFKLLELIAMSLELPAKYLNKYFKTPISTIRLNHYPSCPKPELALGVGPHKDQGALTVLSQDEVGGLDVRRRFDGEWVRVKPISNSYIVNIGDAIQVWSNDKYESAEHRVSVNSTKERFSIPFFLSPSLDITLKPVEELVTEDDPAKYNEFSWGHFYKSRKSSNLQKLGSENLQIYHFRKAEDKNI